MRLRRSRRAWSDDAGPFVRIAVLFAWVLLLLLVYLAGHLIYRIAVEL